MTTVNVKIVAQSEDALETAKETFRKRFADQTVVFNPTRQDSRGLFYCFIDFLTVGGGLLR